MEVTKIPIPIYYGTLRIVITDSFKEATKTLNIDCQCYDPDTFGAFVNISSNGNGLDFFTVFFKPTLDHQLIAHEVVHLVNGIYRERHMNLDKENDEPQAYLTGWVTEQIYKTFIKYSWKVRKQQLHS